MMSDEVVLAVSELQTTALRARETFHLDRADRALDELIRGCTRAAPGGHQLRSALANASKVVRGRRTLFERHVAQNRDSRPGVRRSERFVESSPGGEAEIFDWLERSRSLTSAQRQLLIDLARGQDAESIAIRDAVPVARVRERIARARAAGWISYQVEACAS